MIRKIKVTEEILQNESIDPICSESCYICEAIKKQLRVSHLIACSTSITLDGKVYKCSKGLSEWQQVFFYTPHTDSEWENWEENKKPFTIILDDKLEYAYIEGESHE